MWLGIGAALAGMGAGTWGVLRMRARRHLRWLDQLSTDLASEPDGPAFDPDALSDLPGPARRWLRHAIAPGRPLAAFVRADQRARMKPDAARPHVDLQSRETLAPGRGLVWWARMRMGVPVQVTDHYHRDGGSVRVSLLGLVPVVRAQGPDIARSARGRLVAESLFCPTALVGRPWVRWEPVSDELVRLVQHVDGEDLALVLRVAADGTLLEFRMDRWGNEGREDFGPIPYGYEVLEEGTFDGCTVPARVRGGWWYGTERFRPEDASEFVMVGGRYGAPAAGR